VSQSVLIDRLLIGTKQHLLIGDGFAWVENIIESAWHFDGTIKSTNKCFDTLLRLNNIEIGLDPPKKYVTAMTTLMSGSSYWPPPWQDLMPKATHKNFVQSLVTNVEEALSKLDLSFYNRVWVPGNEVFGCLERAYVNQNLWKRYVDSGEGNTAALKSFQPDENGLAPIVRYNRFGTKTGRPTIASGPQILTLKREQRNLLTSRWGSKGRIVILDFSALEVRVILYEAGLNCIDPDLYQEINQLLFKGKLPRDVVKGAVICDLYGQSRWALGQRLGVQGKHLDAFINKIRTHFKVDQLLKRVKQQFVADGHILNRYGRRVKIDEPLDHVLINAYAQSTGADVVTLGFREIISKLNSFKAIPIYLLVDAILIDCHIDDIDKIEQIKLISVDGYVQRFPLKFEVL
jgi:hypothetical protein